MTHRYHTDTKNKNIKKKKSKMYNSNGNRSNRRLNHLKWNWNYKAINLMSWQYIVNEILHSQLDHWIYVLKQ